MSGISPGYANHYAIAETYHVWEEGAGDCYRSTFEDPEILGDVTVFQVTISGAVTCNDGDSTNLSVTVTPSNNSATYAWSFTAPAGAGNNPQVTFGSSGSANTTASCKWFSLPNGECDGSLSSQYTISCLVNLGDGNTTTKDTSLTVQIPLVGGSVGLPQIQGSPAMAQNQQGVWVITGQGTLTRVVANPQVNLPSASQFYSKLSQHENKHVQQWTDGMLSDLYTVQGFMNEISSLTGSSQPDLISKYSTAYGTWKEAQRQIYLSRKPDAETEAYAVSDSVAPTYKYQKACNPDL